MTAEREAMTLEQVRDKLRKWGSSIPDGTYGQLADAIDAHLSRATEPVAWLLAEDVESLEENKRDPEGVDAIECLLWREHAHEQLRAIYTHPPEPADAKDAARYRWLRVHVFDDQDWGQGECNTPEQVDATIDASMAQESDNG